MNELQRKALHHLTEPGHSERVVALKDLRGILTTHLLTEDAVRREIENYLRRNPHGFCEAGVKRFRDAVGLTPERHESVVKFENVEGGLNDLVVVIEGGPKSFDGSLSTHIVELLKANPEYTTLAGHKRRIVGLHKKKTTSRPAVAWGVKP